MSKKFKSYDEQIEILRERGLVINDEQFAQDILSQVNYYNLINGYKNLFLMKDSNHNVIMPEKFIENASIEEMYNLYTMDTELKNMIFKYILRFERILKTKCAHIFSEKYREDFSYLKINNYSKNKSDIKIVLKNISTLSETISNKANKPAIKHYMNNHDEIPLWVLINFITIGNLSYFYNALENSIQSAIAKEFSIVYKQNYGEKEKIDAGELEDILKIVTLFRNVVAHDEILYSFKLNKIIGIVNFKKYFGNIFTGKSFYDLVLILKLVLPKEEYFELVDKIDYIFNSYRNNFSSIKFYAILEYSGFPNNWKEILL